MSNIVSAKRELFNKLKYQSEIMGAGIKGTGKSEYIVIFVSELSTKIKKIIPNSYKGIKVKTERKGIARSM